MSRRDRLTESLRGLDRRVVPAAAALLRRAAGALAPLRESGRLQRLDDRFARGPLALVRELPQLGLLVVAAVFLAGTAAVLVERSGPSTVAAEEPGTGLPVGSPGPPVDDGLAELGPTSAQDAAEYVDGARARLDGATPGEGPFLALVSLSAPLTAEAVAETLGPAALVAVLLQVPSAERVSDVTLFEVNDAAAVAPAFADLAGTRRAEAEELVTVAATIQATTPEETESKALFQREAVAYTAEADQLEAGCACVVALVVRGSGATLAALAGRPGVRVVDPGRASADTLGDVRLLPPGLEGPVPAGAVRRG